MVAAGAPVTASTLSLGIGNKRSRLKPTSISLRHRDDAARILTSCTCFATNTRCHKRMKNTRKVDVQEAWTRVSAGECLYHMATTNILSYCVFDTVIDLADQAATAAIEAEMANALNGTNANFTVVSSDVSETSWFEGGLRSVIRSPMFKSLRYLGVSLSKCIPAVDLFGLDGQERWFSGSYLFLVDEA